MGDPIDFLIFYREFIQNEPRFRGLVKEMDSSGGEVPAFYENELQKRSALYEQMAGGSGKGTEGAAKKEPTDAWIRFPPLTPYRFSGAAFFFILGRHWTMME